jgi:hypothetical protein
VVGFASLELHRRDRSIERADASHSVAQSAQLRSSGGTASEFRDVSEAGFKATEPTADGSVSLALYDSDRG